MIIATLIAISVANRILIITYFGLSHQAKRRTDSNVLKEIVYASKEKATIHKEE